MPTSRVVTGLRNSALLLSGSFSPSNSATTVLCSALASLASLNFLRLGGKLKAKTVSGLSVCLDGPNPSSTDETSHMEIFGCNNLVSYKAATRLNFFL